MLYFIDIRNERGIAFRKILESRKVCNTPDFTCIQHLAATREGADIDCVVAIEKELKLLASREKKRGFFLDLVKRSIEGYSSKHYVKPKWVIGPHQLGIKGCCRGCVCHYYEICDATLTNYCSLVKKGMDQSASNTIGDKSVAYEYTTCFKNALDSLARYGHEIDHTMMAAMQIPNSKPVSILCVISNYMIKLLIVHYCTLCKLISIMLFKWCSINVFILILYVWLYIILFIIFCQSVCCYTTHIMIFFQ